MFNDSGCAPQSPRVQLTVTDCSNPALLFSDWSWQKSGEAHFATLSVKRSFLSNLHKVTCAGVGPPPV